MSIDVLKYIFSCLNYFFIKHVQLFKNIKIKAIQGQRQNQQLSADIISTKL